MLGLKLNNIHLGRGGTISIGSRLQVGLFPFLTGGFTTFQPADCPIGRSGSVFLNGAGILVNLALVLAALLLIHVFSGFGWALLIFNSAAFVHNLTPMRSAHSPGGWNDGAMIWRAIFRGR